MATKTINLATAQPSEVVTLGIEKMRSLTDAEQMLTMSAAGLLDLVTSKLGRNPSWQELERYCERRHDFKALDRCRELKTVLMSK